jgi:N-acetylmuramoyl-L-alanine amidase
MDEIEILCYDTVMYQARLPKHNQAVRRSAKAKKKYGTFSITMLSLVIVAILVGFRLFALREEQPAIFRIAQPASATIAIAPTVSAAAGSPESRPTRDLARPLVGVVAGHKGYDPGAVCDDGLTEVEINHAIAVEVVNLLERRRVQADLLDEYDPRLTDYQADALISVHADSCNVPGATGFKVARVTSSAIPEAEDALVSCLSQEYGLYTGLPEHPASITDNMTNYHAFNEIAPLTPGAIIETGFMLDDRFLLQHKPKIVARGIAAGILCFLNE